MINEYQLQVRAKCPIHEELIDVYAVTVRSESTIMVEQIVAWFGKYEGEQILQEEMAKASAVALGAEVEIVGIHSGVRVRSVAP